MPIFLLLTARADEYGEGHMSLWALRGQLWLHAGGASKQAAMHLRRRKEGPYTLTR